MIAGEYKRADVTRSIEGTYRYFFFFSFPFRLSIFNDLVADVEQANEVITAILPGGHRQYKLASTLSTLSITLDGLII
jgi:hypothetical protein